MDDIKEKFDKLFSDLYDIPKENTDNLFYLTTFQHIEKGTNLVEQGNYSHLDYFLVEGILREYVINEEGKDITLNFLKRGVITPNFCRTQNGRSLMSIQALTSCLIGVTDASKIQELRAGKKEFFFASSLIMTKLFKEKIATQIINSSEPAVNRLAHLRKEFPGLENEVPNTYIASYLGITNVSLSRLRKIR